MDLIQVNAVGSPTPQTGAMQISAPRPVVLIVAPEADLRLSLAFLLEAEGYAVRTAPAWPLDSDPGPIDGLVIDESGLQRGYEATSPLSRFGNRIVMLVSQIGKMTQIPSATIVRKPLLETMLVDSLRTLL